MKNITYTLVTILLFSGVPEGAFAHDEAAHSPTEVQSLINGKDLSNWTIDVPEADDNPNTPPSFIYKNGSIHSMGVPEGHIITNASYKNYRLVVEYRFTGEPGNCGVLVHTSELRNLYGMFPKSIEVQMESGSAGDFWVIGEDIKVPDMEARRPREEGEKWGGNRGDARHIFNLTDGSENPVGEWNQMVIDARDDTVKVWVNGDLVNYGFDGTVSMGKIALQAEGSGVEFRRLDIGPLGFKY